MKGLTRAAPPRTKAMLLIFEPMAFPTAISGFPVCRDANAETKNSGEDVPSPTMVRPTVRGDIP